MEATLELNSSKHHNESNEEESYINFDLISLLFEFRIVD